MKLRLIGTSLMADGVKNVNNLLQPGPQDRDKAAANDIEIKDRVRASLEKDRRFDDITVAGVTDGLVLLLGKAHGLDETLLAIERACSVAGVCKVASEIELVES